MSDSDREVWALVPPRAGIAVGSVVLGDCQLLDKKEGVFAEQPRLV